MEIDLFADPPTTTEIDAARRELENSRLLILQNEAHVAELYHRLLVKGLVIVAMLLAATALYFILPGSIFGMDNGRTTMIITVSVMLLTSMVWIVWRTWNEARAILPDRENSKEQMQRLKSRMAGLLDADVKQRLNAVNWSRADGVLTEYLKKVTRQRRHLVGLEYLAIIKHIEKVSSYKTQ